MVHIATTLVEGFVPIYVQDAVLPFTAAYRPLWLGLGTVAFDLVLGFGGGMAKGKPHLDATSRAFGVDWQEMLFVGDSLHDGEIAEREGVPFVGVATTFSAERFMLRFPQVLQNLPRKERGRLPQELLTAVEQVNSELEGTGRVLVRPSGTEPVVRVLAEAETPEDAETLCARIAALVTHELG